MSDPYRIGTEVTISVDFADLAGVPADPSTVIAMIRRPDGTENTVSTTNPTTGRHVMRVVLNQSGAWVWRMKGTAGLIVAIEGAIEVAVSPFVAP